MSERCGAVKPVGVVSHSGEDLASDLGANAEKSDQCWCGFCDQHGEVIVDLVDLIVEGVEAACENSQGMFGCCCRI